MELAAGKYLAFTTYRSTGESVTIPVWVVTIDGRDDQVAFTTGSTSGKVRRLAERSDVQAQPSSFNGTPHEGTEPVDGTAEIVTGDRYQQVRSKVRSKYGLMVPFAKFVGLMMGVVKRHREPFADCAVIITLTA